ncbi:MAG: tyrosine-protein kinase family protein [Chitinophagaceae bacterium]|nr:tyrosine-protein kinase family protein [Rubrivivax sp.]
MSSLIEQAALRLEQLRQAGVELAEIEVPKAPAAGLATSLAAEALRPSPAASRVLDATASSRRITIDLDAVSAGGILTPNAPRSHVADQYRVLKRPLISNAMGKGAATIKHSNLIMVTSALAGEGKSFTSINLAMSIAAELDHTVMLVDADVARPSVLRVLGLPPGPGLLDLLEGKADMAGVLLRTNIDKLTLLPSGTPHARATELLASEAMSQLLDDMATRYPDRIIIFDSPPLLLTTESRVLATHMGQIVVVVNAGVTLQANVQQALATIESCPVKMMVLNKSTTDSAGGYGYGYGYGAGYGYGYGAGSDLKPES